MSTFQTMITDDLDVILDTNEFAQAITYNGTSINAIVRYGEERESDASVSFDAVITVKVSDVATPTYRDTVVIGGVTFRVFQDANNQPFKGDGYLWQIRLTRGARPPVGGKR